jgi:biotin transport system substrate-specific component
MDNAIINIYKNKRYCFFKWRSETTVVYKVVMAFTLACFTGLMAQMRIHLPWTPVPITMQTLAVMISAVLLGKYYGGLSQVMYVGLGVAGLPWFAGFSGGAGALLGATGGYLISFILASLFVGFLVDRRVKARTFPAMLGIMLFTSFVIIYGIGLLQLYAWYNIFDGSGIGIGGLLIGGAIPFIPGDIIKSIAAASIGCAITPKKAYNGEVDRY